MPPLPVAFFTEAAGVVVAAATCQVSFDGQASGVSLASASSGVVAQAHASEGEVNLDATGTALVEVSLNVQPVIVAGNQEQVALVSASIQAKGSGGAVLPQQCQAIVTVSLQAAGTRIEHGAHQGQSTLDARRFVERWIDNRPDYRFSDGARTRQFFQRRR